MNKRIETIGVLLILLLGALPAVQGKTRVHPTPTFTPTETVTDTETPAPTATNTPEDLYGLDTTWGSPGDGLDQLNDPEGLSIASDGHMAIADSGNHRVLIWTTDGQPVRAFGSFGSSAVWRNPPQFNHPEGVMLMPSGLTYVADTFNHRIVVVDQRGLVSSTWGHHGTDNGNFDQPRAFALGQYGDIWILDTGNSRLQLFSPQGAYKSQWGTFGADPGFMKNPTGMALNIIEQVQIADTGNFRYQVFNSDGSSVTYQGWLGDGPNQYREPSGVAVTPQSWIAVSDGINGRVLFYNNRFEYMTQWRALDDPAWKLPAPHFRAITSDARSRLYLTDIANNVVVRLIPRRKVTVVAPEDTPTTQDQQGLYGGPGFPVR